MNMKKPIFFLILFLISTNIFSQEITGNWLGALDIMGNKLRIGFNIEKTDTVYKTKMDSPDQGAFGLPTSKTTFANDTLKIDASGLGISYTGALQGDSINGTFAQGGLQLPLILKRTEKPTLNRPQEPQPPFPYKTEDVVFQNKKAKIDLAGTLTLPDSAGMFPAVILVHGSGPHDRDETILGHKPFLVLADYLTKNGIAVLRYDKRGVGQSKGDFATAITDDFADDAAAAVAFLRTRNEIDKKRIGIIGHSEGGIIAPMAAASNRNIAFIVLMAAPGIKGIDIIMAQNEKAMKQQNMEPENIEKLQKINREIFESLADWQGTEADRTALRDKLNLLWDKMPLLVKLRMNKDQYIRGNFNAMIRPWYRNSLQLNPETYLTKVSCPVFAINGEKDTQVIASDNLNAIKKALEKGKNYRSETKTYPNLNHLFQHGETGQVDEYGKIEQTISEEVLEDVVNWIKKIIALKRN